MTFGKGKTWRQLSLRDEAYRGRERERLYYFSGKREMRRVICEGGNRVLSTEMFIPLQ